MVYIVEGPKYTHKRHQNQLQKCRLNDSNNVPQTEEEPIDTIFDMFDLNPPQSTPEIRRSGREKEIHKPVDHIYQPLRSGRIWHKVNF